MEMLIDFPGGSRVDAHFGSFTVQTDQPPEASAPTPFEVFLASFGTCAGIFVLGFCRQRNLSTDGLRIVQRVVRDQQTGLVGRISLDIQLPADFPEKYRQALIQSARRAESVVSGAVGGTARGETEAVETVPARGSEPEAICSFHMSTAREMESPSSCLARSHLIVSMSRSE